jgi:hypothetical protein
MRRLVVLVLVSAALLPSIGAAQASKGRVIVAPAPTTQDAGLKGEQAPPPPTPIPSLAQSRITQSGLAQGGLSPGGLFSSGLSSPGLDALGLAPVGDAAPACRAQCAENRYNCTGDANDQGCDNRWTACVQACGAP